MIGVPPICQSADGNGGESKGVGGIRRLEGVDESDWVYAGALRSSANADKRFAENAAPSPRAVAAKLPGHHIQMQHVINAAPLTFLFN